MQQRICDMIKMKPPVNADRGVLSASGATVPTDGTDGYQASCYFQDTTNGIIYINEGSVTSCEFNSSTTGGASDILTIGAFSSLTAGSGIAISSTQTGAAKIYSDDNGLLKAIREVYGGRAIYARGFDGTGRLILIVQAAGGYTGARTGG